MKAETRSVQIINYRKLFSPWCGINSVRGGLSAGEISLNYEPKAALTVSCSGE
jgi:hypothetical protein